MNQHTRRSTHPQTAAIGVLLAAVAVLASTSALHPTAARAAGRSHAADTTDWLGRVNYIRVASGLSPVVNDPDWTAGIDAHLTYLENTPTSYEQGEYASAHTENPSSPYYTVAGDQEGGRSNLAFGTDSPVGAINQWLAAPFHAIGILRPNLQTVAFARHDSSGDAGLDVIGGLVASAPLTQPVFFPGNGSTIDLAHGSGESPSPYETCTSEHPGADYDEAGLPLIALLPSTPAADLTATLSEPGGGTVSSAGNDLCLVDENTYTSTDPVYGTTGKEILEGDHAVLVIPRTRLLRGDYTVSLTASGQPAVTWSFTSDAPGDQPEVGTGAICSASNASTGEVRLSITNTVDGVGPASYLVTVGAASQATPSIADGATTKVTFTGIAPGAEAVAITGSDGSTLSYPIQIGTCSRWEEAQATFGAVHLKRGYATVHLDNTLNNAPTTFVIKGYGLTRQTFGVAAAGSETVTVALRSKYSVSLSAYVSGHRLATKNVSR